jgi:hypothetical protein
MWRCPHCGTPQAETARCWVCRRSSTACGTCRNFRRSVAGSLGYCGLDRRRQPLAGDEIRACWEAEAGANLTLVAPPTIRPAADGVPGRHALEPLEFVEVRALPVAEPSSAAGEVPPLPPGPVQVPIPSPGESGWSLWGELDR